MAFSEILACIDSDIAQLQQVRAILIGGSAPTAKKAVGRPKKVAAVTKKATVASVLAKPAKKKRNLSPEGRKRIAEAVKKRWAKQKAASAK
jgi:hypothetical protein